MVINQGTTKVYGYHTRFDLEQVKKIESTATADTRRTISADDFVVTEPARGKIRELLHIPVRLKERL
jgi:hypothetical protein